MSDKPDVIPGGALLAAALCLPLFARAEGVPEAATLSYKFLNYQDSQPAAQRIRVNAPAFELVLPMGDAWSIGAGHVVDTISGASPAYHTEALTKLHDRRRSSDVALTHYSDSTTLSLGASYSSEADYISRGLNVGGTLSSADKNTTWHAGLGLMHDTINPSNQIVYDEHKNVVDLSFGVDRVLSTHDLVQMLAGLTHGSGYYSDPYKVFDERPRERRQHTLLARWNHHIDATGASTHLSYRYYGDSFGIRAHTLAFEYIQPLAGGWTISPSARIYTQSAASFYVDLDPAAAPFPTNPPDGARYFSEEQRLAAYGGRGLGIKLAKQLGLDWRIDFKAERYQQRASWTVGGSGSPNLAPFTAVSYQLGLVRRF